MSHSLSVVALLISFSIAPAAVLSLPYREGGPVVAIFPPWADMSNAVRNSGAKEIFPLRTPIAILLDNPSPNIRTSLKENGAWLFLNGTLIATICGAKNV